MKKSLSTLQIDEALKQKLRNIEVPQEKKQKINKDTLLQLAKLKELKEQDSSRAVNFTNLHQTFTSFFGLIKDGKNLLVNDQKKLHDTAAAEFSKIFQPN